MRGHDVQYGGVTLLTSPEGGRYPSGNSLLIRGTEGTVLVDPSLEVDRRGGAGGDIEFILSGFGMADGEADVFRQQLRETFHVSGHGRVDTVEDGAVLELGRRSLR